jgi:hypothetical protein
MTKEELDKELEKVSNSFNNMNEEDMNKFILENKDKTINDFKENAYKAFEIMEFIKDKDVSYLKLIITFSVQKIEDLLTNTPTGFCRCKNSSLEELGDD